MATDDAAVLAGMGPRTAWVTVVEVEDALWARELVVPLVKTLHTTASEILAGDEEATEAELGALND